MRNYSVKELALLAGITVRTLHHYDQIDLLKPSIRTRAGYRQYGENELLKLQQILIYKELDFSLGEIKNIIDDPDFDLVEALENHKKTILERKIRLGQLLDTLDKTINHLKNGIMLDHKELYDGIPLEKAAGYRNEAIENWGEAVENSEHHLMKMGKVNFTQLRSDFDTCWRNLANLTDQDPRGGESQKEIAKHYDYILQFWGVTDKSKDQSKAYLGLAELYINDDRFTKIDEKSVKGFGLFLKNAMTHYIENKQS